MKNIQYIPRILTSIIFLLLLIIVFILFLGRKKVFFRINKLPDLLPDFYQHVSNFSISFLLFTGIGYFWLMMGVRFKYITGMGIAILISNFVYELWIPILNVPDIIDAYYGMYGTICAFIFLLLTKKYGLKPNNMNNEYIPGVDIDK